MQDRHGYGVAIFFVFFSVEKRSKADPQRDNRGIFKKRFGRIDRRIERLLFMHSGITVRSHVPPCYTWRDTQTSTSINRSQLGDSWDVMIQPKNKGRLGLSVFGRSKYP
jgi:hypothetical protein